MLWALLLLFAALPCLGSTNIYCIDIRSLNSGQFSYREVYDESHVLAGIAGLVNRHTPRLYVLNTDVDEFWLQYTMLSWLNHSVPVFLNSTLEVVKTFHAEFRGLVVYDGAQVASSSLVASTIAGQENLIPVAKSLKIFDQLTALLPVKIDLSGMFNGNVTGSAKNDALRYALQFYMPSNGTGNSPPFLFDSLRVVLVFVFCFFCQSSKFAAECLFWLFFD